MICFAQRANGRFALERTTEHVGLGGQTKTTNQQRNIGLLVNAEISGPMQVTPHAIRTVAETRRVHRLCGNYQLGSEGIPTIELSGKRPKTISEPDLMQQRVGLVEVKTDPIIQVTPVIIAAPEVKEIHRLTARPTRTDAPGVGP